MCYLWLLLTVLPSLCQVAAPARALTDMYRPAAGAGGEPADQQLAADHAAAEWSRGYLHGMNLGLCQPQPLSPAAAAAAYGGAPPPPPPAPAYPGGVPTGTATAGTPAPAAGGAPAPAPAPVT